MTAQYRKKPVVVEAWQYPHEPTAHDSAYLHGWINGNGGETQVTERGNAIRTLEGFLLITPGDWIIRGVTGEFYPCKPVVFEASYEPAEAKLAAPFVGEFNRGEP